MCLDRQRLLVRVAVLGGLVRSARPRCCPRRSLGLRRSRTLRGRRCSTERGARAQGPRGWVVTAGCGIARRAGAAWRPAWVRRHAKADAPDGAVAPVPETTALRRPGQGFLGLPVSRAPGPASASSCSRWSMSCSMQLLGGGAAVGDVPGGVGEVGHPDVEVRVVSRCTATPGPGRARDAPGSPPRDWRPGRRSAYVRAGAATGTLASRTNTRVGARSAAPLIGHEVGDAAVDVQAGVAAALGQVHRREHRGDRGRGEEELARLPWRW